MAATSAIRSFGFASMVASKTDRKPQVYPNQPRAYLRGLSRNTSVIRASPTLCKTAALSCKKSIQAKESIGDSVSSDGRTLSEAIQRSAGPLWDNWNAAKDELVALPPRGRRVRHAGIAPYNNGLDNWQREHALIDAKRSAAERRFKVLCNDIWANFQKNMIAGRWMSTGSCGSASTMPTPLPALGWNHFAIDWTNWTLIEHDTKARIYNIRIFPEQTSANPAHTSVPDDVKRQSAKSRTTAANPEQTRPDTKIEAQRACLEFLEAEMRKSPGHKHQARDWYFEQAPRRWPKLSKLGFQYSWRQAIENTGADVWAAPGRPVGRKARVQDKADKSSRNK